jgi:hypothetical protein
MNLEIEKQEIAQFQSNVRSITGRIIECFTRLVGHVENFFGWPQARRAKLEAEAEGNFRLYSGQKEGALTQLPSARVEG